MRSLVRSVGLAVAAILSLAGSGDGLDALPHHDWAMVGPDAGATALPRLLSALEAGLEGARLEPGFPRRCRVVTAPSEGGVGVRSCREPAIGEAPDGLLISANGAHVEIALVETPDTRVYLFEVHLVRAAVERGALLPPDSRLGAPRLTVSFPRVEPETLEVLPALRRGLEIAGAVPVEIEALPER
jgi:hypothetical protein